jgi:hypothetical protein
VAVGGKGVSVGGKGVSVGDGVPVGWGLAVAVGGTGVRVGGMGDGMSVGSGVAVGSGVLLGADVTEAAGRVAVGTSGVEVAATATTVGVSVGSAFPQEAKNRVHAVRVTSTKSRKVWLQRSLFRQAGMPARPCAVAY